MTASFDPYLQWLGIRDPQRPPNHYRLLGIDVFESDPDVIATAADRQMSHVRTYQTGPQAELSQKLLNELSAARVCLLKPDRKAEYDKQLRQAIGPRTAKPVSPVSAPPPPLPLVQPVVMATKVGPVAGTHSAMATMPAEAELSADLADLSVAVSMAQTTEQRGRLGRRGRSKISAAPWTLGIMLLAALLLFGAAWYLYRPSASQDKSATVARPMQKTSDFDSGRALPTSLSASSAPTDDNQSAATHGASPNGTGTSVAPDKPVPTSSETPRQALNLPTGNSADGERTALEKLSPTFPPPTETEEAHGAAATGKPSSETNTSAAATAADDGTTVEEEVVDPADKSVDTATHDTDDAARDSANNEDDHRLAVPPPEQLDAAKARIRDVFADELAAAKSAAAKAALAHRLLEKSLESSNDPPAEYMLLTMVAELGLAAGATDVVFAAMDRRGERFQIETIDEKTQALLQLEKLVKSREARDDLVYSVDQLIAQALDRERYHSAETLAAFQVRMARSSRERDSIKSALQHEKQVQNLAKLYEAAEAARQRLAEDANHTEANYKLGVYLCFVRNDWRRGAQHLAKGSDAALQAIALDEVAQPSDPKKQLALAEAWDKYAEPPKPYSQEAHKRARHWYASVVHQLEGLDKTKAEKRLAALSEEALGGSTGPLVAIDLASGVKLPMRRVPAGKFWMGSPPTEPGRSTDENLHEVTISTPFLLGVTEVTQAQWEVVMGKSQSEPKGPNLPVNNVSWHDAVRFCDQLNRTPLSAKYRFRLPTEAEWEYACRAGTKTFFYWGNDPSRLPQYAWTAANSGKTIQPVGKLKPNAWGFFDMSGNVAEWTMDWQGPLSSAPQRDPTGLKTGTIKSHRGHSKEHDLVAQFRVSARGGNPADEVRPYLGFRLAAEIR